jgi:CcmD family protein
MPNQEVYQVALGGAPYVIAAYMLIWVTLVVFIGLSFRRLLRLEKEITVVEDAVKRRSAQ